MEGSRGPMLPWQSPYAAQAAGPGDAPVPTVYVQQARRRDAEAFALQLEDLGGPPGAPVEALGFARMDAAALLQRLADGNSAVLAELQAAVVARDMLALAAAVEARSIGTGGQRQELRTAVQIGDRQAAADVLRRMAQPALNAMMKRAGPKPCMAMEVAGPSDPMMDTERRIAADIYLTGDCINPQSFSMRKPPAQDSEPLIFGNLKLGYDAMDWEGDCLFHPYLQDGANAMCNLGLEAVATGELDGRLLGTRTLGPKY